MESILESLKGKTLDQVDIDSLYSLFQEIVDKAIDKKMKNKRNPYAIRIEDKQEQEKAVFDAIDACMRADKRPTVKALLGRKHILKRLKPKELSDLLDDMESRSVIQKDTSKAKPAYYHSGGF